MSESLQHRLDRVRPPRVQITYDVEIGGAIQMKELPFVVGILADLSGKPVDPLPRLKERKFVEIDRDNFNDVLASIKPRIALRANNALAKDGSKLNVELTFSNIDDFGPAKVIEQVPVLKKLFEARRRLSDLLTKLDGNDDLDSLLKQAASDRKNLANIREALPAGTPPAAAPPAAAPPAAAPDPTTPPAQGGN